MLERGPRPTATAISSLVGAERWLSIYPTRNSRTRNLVSDTFPLMPTNTNLFRTNVQDILPADVLEWAYEQMATAPQRMSQLTREDYYSILADLYRKLNPPIAGPLLRTVRESDPSIEWLDKAIVFNQALLRAEKHHLSPRQG